MALGQCHGQMTHTDVELSPIFGFLAKKKKHQEAGEGKNKGEKEESPS